MKKSHFGWTAVLLFTLSVGMSADAAVSMEEAQEIAYRHAGLSPDAVYTSHVKLETENNRTIYDVEFFSDMVEYDYDIDAETGEILKFGEEQAYYRHRHFKKAARTDIGIEAAAEKALAQVEGATKRHLNIRKDYDHGRLMYEGEIHYSGYEYEFEIDSATGEFVEWAKEKY